VVSRAIPMTKEGIWAKHKGAITILAVFGLVLLVRGIFTNSIYPASTGDTANHLAVIDAISRGDWGSWAYLGEVIVGVPVLLVAKTFGLDIATVFLVAEYLLLFGIGYSLYFVVSSLVNKKAAMLTILLAMLCTPSIFRLFSSGTIFSAVNMCLILPLAIYFLVKLVATRRKIYIIPTSVLVVLFSVFHPSGMSLMFAAGAFFVGYVAYKLIRGYRRQALVYGCLGIGVVGINLAVVALIQHPFGKFMGEVGTGLVGFVKNITSTSIISIGQFTFDFITLAPLAILVVAIVGLIQYRKLVKWSNETRLYLLMLSSFVPFLIIGAFTNLTVDPWRHALDLSVILAIVAACLAGIVLTAKKSMLFIVVIMGLVGLGMIPTLSTFFELQGV